MNKFELSQAFFDASNDMDTDAYSGEYEGYGIELTREDESDNWYIQVAHPSGGLLYDGWWSNSDREPIGAAMQEAITGSELLTNFQ